MNKEDEIYLGGIESGKPKEHCDGHTHPATSLKSSEDQSENLRAIILRKQAKLTDWGRHCKRQKWPWKQFGEKA